MKKIMPMIISLVALIVVAISLTLAWYTSRVENEVIDANTEGISFIYNINDGQVNNPKEYNANNLVFFDPQSSVELSYLLDMALKLKITVINSSNKSISVNISQVVSAKTIIKEDDTITSSSYVQCLLSEDENIDLTNQASITTLIPNYNNLNTNLNSYNEIEVNGDKTVNSNCMYEFYVYVFGIQEIKASSNEFLSKNYGFSINISSLPYKE